MYKSHHPLKFKYCFYLVYLPPSLGFWTSGLSLPPQQHLLAPQGHWGWTLPPQPLPRTLILSHLAWLCLPLFHVVQLPSCAWLFVTPWTVACQASLSLTNLQSLPKFLSIASMMPSSHLILWHPLLLPSVFPPIMTSFPYLNLNATSSRKPSLNSLWTHIILWAPSIKVLIHSFHKYFLNTYYVLSPCVRRAVAAVLQQQRCLPAVLSESLAGLLLAPDRGGTSIQQDFLGHLSLPQRQPRACQPGKTWLSWSGLEF